MRKFISLCFILGIFNSCNSPFTPKPRAYYKIDLPEHTYKTFNDPSFPYQFEYPVYARITKDSSMFEDNPDFPYWFNIDFPSFNGRIYMSYKTIGGVSTYKVKHDYGYKDSTALNTFEGLRDEAFKMSFKHSMKASSIDDSLFKTTNGVSGVYFSVGGNAATAQQFFVTDTTKHFLRGALYFDASPNADSLKPVTEFLKKDLLHLIETFTWRNK